MTAPETQALLPLVALDAAALELALEEAALELAFEEAALDATLELALLEAALDELEELAGSYEHQALEVNVFDG